MITYNLESKLMKILQILSVFPLLFLTDTSNFISICKSLIISITPTGIKNSNDVNAP